MAPKITALGRHLSRASGISLVESENATVLQTYPKTQGSDAAGKDNGEAGVAM